MCRGRKSQYFADLVPLRRRAEPGSSAANKAHDQFSVKSLNVSRFVDFLTSVVPQCLFAFVVRNTVPEFFNRLSHCVPDFRQTLGTEYDEGRDKDDYQLRQMTCKTKHACIPFNQTPDAVSASFLANSMTAGPP